MESLSYKTISANAATVTKEWVLIDATDAVVGRLASQVAKILRGKNKPSFTPHVDCGDNVIIINCAEAVLTGKKLEKKLWQRHTGWIGGIKETTPAKILAGKFPGRVIEKAVERMISRNPLGRQQMTKLRVYAGAEHPHTAQNPIVLDIASKNPKNKRSPL